MSFKSNIPLEKNNLANKNHNNKKNNNESINEYEICDDYVPISNTCNDVNELKNENYFLRTLVHKLKERLESMNEKSDKHEKVAEEHQQADESTNSSDSNSSPSNREEILEKQVNLLQVSHPFLVHLILLLIFFLTWFSLKGRTDSSESHAWTKSIDAQMRTGQNGAFAEQAQFALKRKL